MCRAVTCRTCGKTTWAGCGQHADQVLANVAPAKRCPGHADERHSTGSSALKRIFGRG